MDEPFGVVVEISRASLQDEILRIHKETNITILFVTHDIQEALKLMTKVLILDHGDVQQYAAPQEVLEHPANRFAEELIRMRK